ncbi:MAG TPA: laccase domain-containing protein, partial [Chloroflexia bacterium]|nr:laccase domain-containing protein [Chloroflexia bacterium]
MRTQTISSSDSASGRNPARPAGVPVRDGIYSVLALRPYTDLLHGISTRLSPDGTDWNLSARRGTPANPPDPEIALANRTGLAHRLGISLDRMVGCQQVHGNEVALVGEEDAGKGMLPGRPALPDCDAMITATPGLYLLAL